ncbi:unnamed protein product [Amoebophrya sp. A25]|nr:unnamed protein product [Amoebophrya sp. A25]|eukprot:GSA25T00015132001.1
MQGGNNLPAVPRKYAVWYAKGKGHVIEEEWESEFSASEAALLDRSLFLKGKLDGGEEQVNPLPPLGVGSPHCDHMCQVSSAVPPSRFAQTKELEPCESISLGSLNIINSLLQCGRKIDVDPLSGQLSASQPFDFRAHIVDYIKTLINNIHKNTRKNTTLPSEEPEGKEAGSRERSNEHRRQAPAPSNAPAPSMTSRIIARNVGKYCGQRWNVQTAERKPDGRGVIVERIFSYRELVVQRERAQEMKLHPASRGPSFTFSKDHQHVPQAHSSPEPTSPSPSQMRLFSSVVVCRATNSNKILFEYTMRKTN